MPVVANLIHETSTTTGTGDLTVTAVKNNFNNEFGTGGSDVFDYFVTNRDAVEWEYGTGHLSDSTTLVRDTVTDSSNSGSLVSFTAGTLDVSNDIPAASQVQTDLAQVLTNKTLTLPQINDTSSDHQYIFAVAELAADRTVSLPLLAGNDTFLFEAFAATLTNKTINSASNTLTLDLGEGTLTGSIAEFDAALQSDTFVFTSEVGSVVQAFDTNLEDIAALGVVADNEIMVGTGAGTYAFESGATLRTSIDVYSTAEVDAAITAEDLDVDADSGGPIAIDLDSETLTIAGGAGIDTSAATNTITVAVDSSVAILSAAQEFSAINSFVISDGVNDIKRSVILGHNVSIAPVLGIGAGLQFNIEVADGEDLPMAYIDAITTDVGAGTEDVDLSFKVATGGAAPAEVMRITSLGSLSVTTADLANIGLTGSAAEFDTALQSDTFLFTSEVGTVVLAQQTIGIADNNLLEVDGSPNANEYARFTAAGLEGRTEAEFKADFNLEIGTDVQAQDANLEDIAALGVVADNEIMVGTGAGTYAFESGATLRTSIDVYSTAEVDAAITAEDLDVTADSGGPIAIDLDSETLTLAGGTGLDSVAATNTVTFNIDSTVVTLTGTQTLENKTFTDLTDNASVLVAIMEGNRATPANGDEAYISFRMSDTVGGQDEMARITWEATTATSDSEVGSLIFGVSAAGTNTNELTLNATSLSPFANDGLALGTTALGYSDLHLANEGIINWNNGDFTISENFFGGEVDAPTGKQFRIGFNGTTNYQFNETGLLPLSDNDRNLGGGSQQWAQLYLGAGGDINWNGGATSISNFPAGEFLSYFGAQHIYEHDGDDDATVEVMRFIHDFDNASVHIASFWGERPTETAGDEAYITFKMKDDANNQDETARITWEATTITSGAEVGKMFLGISAANVNTNYLTLAAGELTPFANDATALGSTTLGFSDVFGADGFVLDMGNGGATITHVAASDSLVFDLDSGNALGSTAFTVDVDGATELTVAGTIVTIGRTDAGGAIVLMPTDGTNEGGEITFTGAGSNDDITFDHQTQDIRFFSSSANTHVLRLFDASSGQFDVSLDGDLYLTKVGSIINWASGDMTATHSAEQVLFGGGLWNFQRGTAATSPAANFTNSNDAATVKVAQFEGDRATAADNDTAYISLRLSNDGSVTSAHQHEFARIKWYAGDVTEDSEDGAIYLAMAIAGAVPVDQFFFNANGLLPLGAASQVLGNAANPWADLALEAGGIIDWNSAATITEASGLLSATGWDMTEEVQFSGDISPAQITADQNNWNPTGHSTCSRIYQDSDAARSITGMANGSAGRIIMVCNDGAFDITFTDEDALSTAANRFELSGSADLAVGANATVFFMYDENASRWRNVGASGGGGPLFSSQSTAPSSPTEGDMWFDTDTGVTAQYVDDGTTTQWVEINTGAGIGFTFSTTAPSSPVDGDLWYDSDNAVLLIYMTDADTSQWVDVSASHTNNVATIGFIIDGGGSTIGTGVKGYIEVPFPGTITAVTMLADQSGSIVVDVWKDTYANYPPVDADSITASAVPTITTAVKSQDTTLTGWTTSVAEGDILGFNVDSATTIQKLTIQLTVTKT